MQLKSLMLLAINWQKYINFIDWQKLLVTISEKIGILVFFTILMLFFRKIGKSLINHFFKRYRKNIKIPSLKKEFEHFIPYLLTC